VAAAEEAFTHIKRLQDEQGMRVCLCNRIYLWSSLHFDDDNFDKFKFPFTNILWGI
jgi:hypothetical protein